MTRRLLMLACSATKTSAPGFVPALERYNGPLWQTLRTVDPRAELAFPSVLSAHVGWKPAAGGVEAYDRRMTVDRTRELLEGGLVASWPQYKRGQMSGGNACAWLASETRLEPFSELCICAGKDYLATANAYTAEALSRGYLSSGARVTIINDQIGLMRRELRAWLELKNKGVQ